MNQSVLDLNFKKVCDSPLLKQCSTGKLREISEKKSGEVEEASFFFWTSECGNRFIALLQRAFWNPIPAACCEDRELYGVQLDCRNDTGCSKICHHFVVRPNQLKMKLDHPSPLRMQSILTNWKCFIIVWYSMAMVYILDHLYIDHGMAHRVWGAERTSPERISPKKTPR